MSHSRNPFLLNHWLVYIDRHFNWNLYWHFNLSLDLYWPINIDWFVNIDRLFYNCWNLNCFNDFFWRVSHLNGNLFLNIDIFRDFDYLLNYSLGSWHIFWNLYDNFNRLFNDNFFDGLFGSPI